MQDASSPTLPPPILRQPCACTRTHNATSCRPSLHPTPPQVAGGGQPCANRLHARTWNAPVQVVALEVEHRHGRQRDLGRQCAREPVVLDAERNERAEVAEQFWRQCARQLVAAQLERADGVELVDSLGQAARDAANDAAVGVLLLVAGQIAVPVDHQDRVLHRG
eukprot:293533-Chlamydomonas_euryale.AAC.9